MVSKKHRSLIVSIVFIVSFLTSSSVFAQPEWQWQNPLPQGNGLNGIWGTATDDIYAVGLDGTIVHYDGSAWSRMNSGTSNPLHGVWGTDSNNIYAVGGVYSTSAGATLLRFDGSSWSPVNLPASPAPNTLYAVWGTAANNIYVAGWNGRLYRYNGTQWAYVSIGSNTTIKGLWGSAANNVFAVGDQGTIRRFNGTSWLGMTVPSAAISYNLSGVWGTAANNVYAVGSKFANSANSAIILRYNGTRWSVVSTYAGVQIGSIGGSAADNIYVAGSVTGSAEPYILRFNGVAWTQVATGVATPLSSPSIDGIWGDTQGNTLFVGSAGLILRSDGVDFSSHSSYVTNDILHGVWCGPDNTAMAVGDRGTALYYDGDSWSSMSSGITGSIQAVWGSDDNHVFAVGVAGKILFYNGSDWSPMVSGTTVHLRDVWGSAPNDVYAAGDGVMLHYNGSSWSPVTTLPGLSGHYVNEIWGTAANDVYAMTSYTLLHYNGTVWAEVIGDTYPVYMYDIFGTSSTDIHVTMSEGKVMRYDGVAWTQFTNIYADTVTAAGPDDYFYAGLEGYAYHYDGGVTTNFGAPTRTRFRDSCVRSDGSLVVVGYAGAILSYGMANIEPELVIHAPLDGGIADSNAEVVLSAMATDAEDGDVSAAITWESDIDGAIASPSYSRLACMY
ncbi:hypothetical protein WMF30_29140 [Sorangium sp. So ce134]